MAAYLRKRLRSDDGSVSSLCTVSSSGRGELSSELGGEAARERRLAALRDEYAAARLPLDELCRASREQQAHVRAQLAELEGCSLSAPPSGAAPAGGGGGGGGNDGSSAWDGGICLADLRRQLRAYAAQEQDAAAQLARLERQHQAQVAALLASSGGGGRPGGPEQQQQQQRRGGPLGGTGPPLADGGAEGAQREGAQPLQQPGGSGGNVQAQQQPAQLQQQQQQQPQQQQQQELAAALEREAARVDAAVARVAVEQQLACSALERPRSKKARTEGITQVWEWLNASCGSSGAGPCGGGGGVAASGAANGNGGGGGGVGGADGDPRRQSVDSQQQQAGGGRAMVSEASTG